MYILWWTNILPKMNKINKLLKQMSVYYCGYHLLNRETVLHERSILTHLYHILEMTTKFWDSNNPKCIFQIHFSFEYIVELN